MTKRIEYIDNIKGFTILLVVMGHVIANWFSSYSVVLKDDTDNQLMVWKLIYSFHMPLFMFCSGLFQPILTRESTFKDILHIIAKRFKVLIIPYFISGGLLWLVTGRPSFYWYLLVLFEFTVLTLFVSWIANKFSRKTNIIEGLLIVGLVIVIHIINTCFHKYERLPLLDIGHLNWFFYFILGYVMAKYKLLDVIFKNWLYSLSIVVFVSLFVVFDIYGYKLPHGGLVINKLLPLSAIYAVFYFFKNFLDDSNIIYRFVNQLGKFSLEIYILHFFFLIKIPVLGETIHHWVLNGGGGKLVFVSGISLSLIMALLNLFFCYIVIKILSKSQILYSLLLGRQRKNYENCTVKSAD
jgi:fucose 4-O-acetylase-like acetyltransferase